MNQKDTTLTAPSVDATTIHLIIKGGILLALACLFSGLCLAAFAMLHPNASQNCQVIVAAAGGLLGVPNFAIGGLFAMLARTRTDPQSPTGTPSDPVSVAGPSPSADANPVPTTNDSNQTDQTVGQKDNPNE